MSRALPPLDLHAHVATDVAPRALEELGAVVFAVTRSLDEYEETLNRSDAVTVWGLGCHPGLAKAQKGYDQDRFAKLLQKASFVGEVGLDGSSKVPLQQQEDVLASVFTTITATPRLTSVHSYRATRRVLDLIEDTKVEGVVLHWWLGSETETRRAVELGCLFSVNSSMDVARLKEAGVPVGSLLPETDHPSGNRRGESPRQPGHTIEVERAVASVFDVPEAEVRARSWATLAKQARVTDTFALFPPVVQAMIRHAQ